MNDTDQAKRDAATLEAENHRLRKELEAMRQLLMYVFCVEQMRG